jgi:hypothetical protein
MVTVMNDGSFAYVYEKRYVTVRYSRQKCIENHMMDLFENWSVADMTNDRPIEHPHVPGIMYTTRALCYNGSPSINAMSPLEMIDIHVKGKGIIKVPNRLPCYALAYYITGKHQKIYAKPRYSDCFYPFTTIESFKALTYVIGESLIDPEFVLITAPVMSDSEKKVLNDWSIYGHSTGFHVKPVTETITLPDVVEKRPLTFEIPAAFCDLLGPDCILAGGSVVRAIAEIQLESEKTDYDIFVSGSYVTHVVKALFSRGFRPTDEQGRFIIDTYNINVYLNLMMSVMDVTYNARVVTLVSSHEHLTVDIIKVPVKKHYVTENGRKLSAPEARVIMNFDISICKVWTDGIDVYGPTATFADIADKTMTLETKEFAGYQRTWERLCKYMDRGFELRYSSVLARIALALPPRSEEENVFYERVLASTKPVDGKIPVGVEDWRHVSENDLLTGLSLLEEEKYACNVIVAPPSYEPTDKHLHADYMLNCELLANVVRDEENECTSLIMPRDTLLADRARAMLFMSSSYCPSMDFLIPLCMSNPVVPVPLTMPMPPAVTLIVHPNGSRLLTNLEEATAVLHLHLGAKEAKVVDDDDPSIFDRHVYVVDDAYALMDVHEFYMLYSNSPASVAVLTRIVALLADDLTAWDPERSPAKYLMLLGGLDYALLHSTAFDANMREMLRGHITNLLAPSELIEGTYTVPILQPRTRIKRVVPRLWTVPKSHTLPVDLLRNMFDESWLIEDVEVKLPRRIYSQNGDKWMSDFNSANVVVYGRTVMLSSHMLDTLGLKVESGALVAKSVVDRQTVRVLMLWIDFHNGKYLDRAMLPCFSSYVDTITCRQFSDDTTPSSQTDESTLCSQFASRPCADELISVTDIQFPPGILELLHMTHETQNCAMLTGTWLMYRRAGKEITGELDLFIDTDILQCIQHLQGSGYVFANIHKLPKKYELLDMPVIEITPHVRMIEMSGHDVIVNVHITPRKWWYSGFGNFMLHVYVEKGKLVCEQSEQISHVISRHTVRNILAMRDLGHPHIAPPIDFTRTPKNMLHVHYDLMVEEYGRDALPTRLCEEYMKMTTSSETMALRIKAMRNVQRIAADMIMSKNIHRFT